ncbi:GNAT family N-acetyltransferase [Enterococcus sp. BWR-S5]|uniref:GNAT family N-acetyltransferase n=1 Tax=Enterococcus sp. BWR-S5 TaxID=2787714 RepID=UPI001923A689|nr:GNAT family N-acetyltransferase [Enterococcus sp. BWR-S5]
MERIKYESNSIIYQESLMLRNRILRLPLGKDIFAEDLSIERQNKFYGILVDKQLIATISAYDEAPSIAHVTAFAVEEAYQKMGYGRLLLDFLVTDLAESGFKRVNVDARATAKVFYEKCGFIVVDGPIRNEHLEIDDYKMSILL